MCIRDSYWTSEFGNYLAHELAHYLGLFHTYEYGLTNVTDNIKDTPNFETNNIVDPAGLRLSLIHISEPTRPY